MARLEDNPATDAEAAQLKEKFGYSREEADMLTPDERAEFLSEEDTSNPVAEQAAQDLADGQPDAHADVETDKAMPHEAVELPAAELEEVEDAAAKAKPADIAVETPAAVVETPAAEIAPPVEAAADEPVADPEPPSARRAPQSDDRDFATLRKDLSAKFGEGEISNEQYTDQLAELITAETKQTIRADTMKEAAEDRWLNDQVSFLDANEEYLPKNSPARFAALNDRVKALASDPANASKSGAWHLLEAKRQVEKEIGPAKKAAVVEKPAAVVEPKKPAPPRRPDLKSVPTTLAHVPAAASEDPDGGSEFDQIDKLEGLDYERAIAGMSEAKHEAYMRRSA